MPEQTNFKKAEAREAGLPISSSLKQKFFRRVFFITNLTVFWKAFLIFSFPKSLRQKSQPSVFASILKEPPKIFSVSSISSSKIFFAIFNLLFRLSIYPHFLKVRYLTKIVSYFRILSNSRKVAI